MWPGCNFRTSLLLGHIVSSVTTFIISTLLNRKKKKIIIITQISIPTNVKCACHWRNILQYIKILHDALIVVCFYFVAWYCDGFSCQLPPCKSQPQRPTTDYCGWTFSRCRDAEVRLQCIFTVILTHPVSLLHVIYLNRIFRMVPLPWCFHGTFLMM